MYACYVSLELCNTFVDLGFPHAFIAVCLLYFTAVYPTDADFQLACIGYHNVLVPYFKHCRILICAILDLLLSNSDAIC